MVEGKRRIPPSSSYQEGLGGGEAAEPVVSGAALGAGWDAGALSPFLAQRTRCGCVMTKPPRFRKKKRGRKLCKTGVSRTATLSLYMVLLNGGEAWEQGNQEGVLYFYFSLPSQ